MLRLLIFCALVIGLSADRNSFHWFLTKGHGYFLTMFSFTVTAMARDIRRNNEKLIFSSFPLEECRYAETESGLVQGCTNPGEDYIAFLGLPYAAPPTGFYRFKTPIRSYTWKGVYEADRIVKCPQNGEGTEDCLVVNIFVPIKMYNAPLPVLVYIHGGSFLIGSGQVKGTEHLIRQNIIVVTINYRLGALGFLCLGTEDAPGNAGLKDQVAALQWIQRNIASFGGDPNRVTIYGMSAGGASAELLVLSKQGTGLFQQAIVESASATSVWVTDLDPVNTARTFAEKIGLPTKNINAQVLASYYQRVPARSLSQINYQYYNNLTDGSFGFAPCIENSALGNNAEAFLTESPFEILTKEKYKKVPMMFFYAELEGLFLRSEEFYTQNYTERMSENFLDFMPADLEFDSKEIRIAIAENIKDFYFGNKTIGEDVMEYLNYFGDYLVMHGLLNSAVIHSRGDNPVYLMEFGFKGNMGSYEKFYDNIPFAGHGDVIKHAILNNQAKSKEDKLAIARTVKLIANFVKFGNPIPERSHIHPILWPRVYPNNVTALYMNKEFRVIDEPHWNSKEFWDHIYAKFRKTPKMADPGSL